MTDKTEGSLEFDNLHLNSQKNKIFQIYIFINKLKSY